MSQDASQHLLLQPSETALHALLCHFLTGWPVTDMNFKRRNMQLVHCNMTLCFMVGFLLMGGEGRKGGEVCVCLRLCRCLCAQTLDFWAHRGWLISFRQGWALLPWVLNMSRPQGLNMLDFSCLLSPS